MTLIKLKKEIVKYIIDEVIYKMFPNITITDTEKSPKQSKIVVQINNKPTDKGIIYHEGGRYEIKRLQSFTTIESSVISNIFNIALGYNTLPDSLQKYLVTNTISKVIASSICNISSLTEVDRIAQLIDKLEHWANETYEGHGISFAISIHLDNNEVENKPSNSITIDEILKEDFTKVISNAYDTVLEFTNEHTFIKHKVIELHDMEYYVPFRYLAFAEYTRVNKCVVFVLNRNSELLIIYEGSLLFAKRRGDWRFFSEKIQSQLQFKTRLNTDSSRSLYEAIYQSILDVSFARTGACIGIIDKNNIKNFREKKIVHDKDYLDSKEIKSKVINKIIDKKKFYELDRRLRQELLSIDGSVIVSKEGDIIAVGAILQIHITETNDSDMTGGARLAAAKALSVYGISFKISTDGEISAFHNKDAFRFG